MPIHKRRVPADNSAQQPLVEASADASSGKVEVPGAALFVASLNLIPAIFSANETHNWWAAEEQAGSRSDAEQPDLLENLPSYEEWAQLAPAGLCKSITPNSAIYRTKQAYLRLLQLGVDVSACRALTKKMNSSTSAGVSDMCAPKSFNCSDACTGSVSPQKVHLSPPAEQTRELSKVANVDGRPSPSYGGPAFEKHAQRGLSYRRAPDLGKPSADSQIWRCTR